MDIVFLVDESLRYDQYRTVLQQLPRMLAATWPIETARWRVGATVYSTEVNKDASFYLNTYTSKDAVINALYFASLTFGSVNTKAALRDARTNQFTAVNGDRSAAPNIIISLTSGIVDEQNQNLTLDEASLVKEANIQIYTVAIGYSDRKLIDQVSSAKTENYVLLWFFNDNLNDIVSRLLPRLCNATA